MYERSNTIAAAEMSWHDVINQHNLEFVTQPCSTNGHTTQLCFLKHKQFTTRGAGKGKTDAENKISAYYEALEFYLSGVNYNPYPFIVADQIEVELKYNIIPYRCNRNKFLNKNFKKTRLPWVIYKDFLTEKQYAVPLAAVDLSYVLEKHKEDKINYQRLNLYCASNGLAIGLSIEEALIHSALELLERDAYSYFLIDTFLLNHPISIIDHNSLPDDLLAQVKKIEKDFCDKLVIIKIPSHFNIQVYCVTFLRRKFEIQPRGAGASLNAKFALERAICECIQTYNLMQGEYLARNMSRNDITRHHLVKNVINFPISSLLERNKAHQIDFQENVDISVDMDLHEYLNILIKKIYRKSSLLVEVVYQSEKVSCIRSIIPNSEEFFLIGHCLKINPNSKTNAYIKDQLGYVFDWNKSTGGN